LPSAGVDNVPGCDSGQFASVAAGCSIDAVLRNSPLNSLETRILVGHVLKLSRVQLITHSERVLTANEAQHLSAAIRRRINGEPIAYIIGEREFYGLSFHVTSDVLIPRPETELLVELVTERLRENGRILDMGTGSGAIAVAIAHIRPDAAVTALDINPAALDVARQNALGHGVSINFLHSDWFSKLTDQCFDVIVANPPYIVKGDDHLSQGDLRFEPADALTDHADGMTALRTIIEGAARHLLPDGWLFVEHGYDQSAAVRELFVAREFCQVQSWRDLAGIERATGGTRPIK
jgi:release factor glutamine methyltransferase